MINTENFKLSIFILNNFVHETMREIERETIQSSFNNIPDNFQFISELVEVCMKIPENDENFCYSLLHSKMFQIKFSGLAISEDLFINSFFTLKVFVKDTVSPKNTIFQINNIGFFQNDEFFKVNLPTHFIVLENNTTWSISSTTCSNNFEICNIDVLKRDNCVTSLNKGLVKN